MIRRRAIAGSMGPLLVMAAVLVGLASPAAADDPAHVTVWQSGGLSEATIDAVMTTAAIQRSTVSFRRSGSLRLMGVTRSGEDVQRPQEGFGYPMSSLAVEVDDARLDPSVASAIRTGAVVMSERSAALRGARAGDILEIEGWDREVRPVRIGAVVPDDRMDWYEIVMSDEVADRLQLDRVSAAVISGGSLGTTSSTLRWFVSSPSVRVGTSWDPIVFTDATLPTVAVKERFGEFAFRPTGTSDGIEIEQAWLDANIVDVSIPGLGPFRCNRAVVPYIRAAVAELEGTGLMDEVDYQDFQLAGGCFNPRMMRGVDQGFALSRHAWGIAIDFNPSTNRFGGETNLSEDFGSVLRKWGFAWGATWTIPDGMHFEWVRRPADFEVCAPLRLLEGGTWTVEASTDACSHLG
jgi:hypothetical protein